MAVAEPLGRVIWRQYIPDAEISTKGPKVMAESNTKAPEKTAVAPAKAAPQVGSQPKAPAKAATSTVKPPIGKTIKACKAATVTLKAQNKAKSEEKKKLPRSS